MADNGYAKYSGLGGSGGGGGGSGTVTSVGLLDGSTTPIYSITGSPVTTAGTLTFSFKTQSANLILAGPSSGSAAQPSFRSLVLNDLPAIGADTVLANLTGGSAKPTAAALGTVTETTSSVLTLGSWANATIGSPTITVNQAATSQNGYLSSTDWNTFNDKQASGSYITALTGDGTASGPGSVALTLATVNSNVGSFGSATSVGGFTVNAKGLITAASSTSIQIAESQVTNLVSDLAGKQPTGNYITALTGQVTATGPGSVAATIATNTVTNSNLAQMAANTIKGNNTGSTANAADLTATQVRTLISIAPTIQKFTSTGTTVGHVFTISTSTTCAIGDTYTNNSNTYTVLAALSAQSGQVLFCSGASAPTASGTLTRSSGSGTSSITFSLATALATYTAPSGPSPLYIRVRMAGGGGGGGAEATNAGSAGSNTLFGPLLLVANGGSGGAAATGAGGGGGTASLGVGPIGIAFPGASGQLGYVATSPPPALGGGSSMFGGGGGGSTPPANSGGGGIGGFTGTITGGGGGGSGF